MLTITKANLRKLGTHVDKLGAINAQISALKAKADLHKDALKKSNLHDVAGKKYRAVISEYSTERLDSEMVRTILTSSQVDDCTVLVESTRVSLYDL